MGTPKRSPSAPSVSVTITVCWRDDVMLYRQLKRGEAFTLGEVNCDFAIASSMLGTAKATLVKVADNGTPQLVLLDAFDDESDLWIDEDHTSLADLRAANQPSLPLRSGSSATLQLGELSIDVSCEHERLPRLPRLALNARMPLFQAGVGLVAAISMAGLHFTEPYDFDGELREQERVELARSYLVRAHERRLDPELALAKSHPSSKLAKAPSLHQGRVEGGTGTRAMGEAGALGAGQHRYGVAGPEGSHHDPHLARQAALREAAEFGMIGLLHSGMGNADAPIAIGGGAPPAMLPPTAVGADVVAQDGYIDHGVNPSVDPARDPVSTFAVDVDTGSYTIARRQLRKGHPPPAPAVRAEEFINYFDYGYGGPQNTQDDNAVVAHIAAAPSPYQADHHLVRVALQAKRVPVAERKPVHLVYLVDTSGSMQTRDKLGLVKYSLGVLTTSLRPGDTVALCTYAGYVRELLPPTGVENTQTILAAINGLGASGSTAMASGIDTAYQLAEKGLVVGDVNRVVVLSDGDANVGPTSHEAILAKIGGYKKKGITLSTIGFGTGNYRDDMMERLADAGDGNYSYIDTEKQALRSFSEQVGGLLEVVARDVKVQVEFDPGQVQRYRLIGYENRDVADKDFRKDDIDGGEIGSGHSVTAVYDVELKPFRFASDKPWVTARLRYKPPTGSERATEYEYPLLPEDIAQSFEDAPASLQLASVVAGFAEILRASPHAVHWELDQVAKLAATVDDGSADVAELRELIGHAQASL